MSLELIKKLREITGAGFVDCQEALKEANDDLTKAEEILRKKGQKIALKKQEREVKEGAIAIKQDGQRAAIVELYCETDFVARNENFQHTVEELAEKLLELKPEEFSAWAKEKIQNDLIVKIGENIQLGKFEIIQGDVLSYYVHFNKKLAAVVVLHGGTKELAKELAMQVVAMDPKYLSPRDILTEIVDKEKEVYRSQIPVEKKPAAIIEKIIEGKLDKFYSEVCLLKQAYIKDEDKTIEKLIGESGTDIQIEKFVRFSL